MTSHTLLAADKMADEVTHSESAFDDSVSSTEDKQKCNSSKQTVDKSEKLSDRQVLEAVNKLLKVCIMSHFAV